ncbi:MAG TPA: CRISPR-associated protein Cas5 [Desulfobacterales bacterium]|nr:CRISPR-associated protein Cas5 [Desulfobacterales bacterium]
METEYSVSLEVAGPAAMFTRPDTGSTPISYPVPTFSAAKGMFEAVLRRPHVYVYPTRVEICRPVRYERYVTNYGGPLRKQDQINKNNNYQLIATILVDVCYRIYGEIRMKQMSTRGKGVPKLRRRRGQDWRPRFKALFEERMTRSQTFYTPCLGWKEFVPCYFGPFRKSTRRDTSVDGIVIPSFLCSMWENRKPKPEYVQDWQIVRGMMSYVHQTPTEEEFYAE